MLESMRHQHLPGSNDPGMLLRFDHYFSTPVYMSLTRDYNLPSIPLKRFRPKVPRSRSSSSYDDPRQHRHAEREEDQELREPAFADPQTPPHSLRNTTQADEADFGNREVASYIAKLENWKARVLNVARQNHEVHLRRIRLVESGALNSSESKRLRENPNMSAWEVQRLFAEVERRVAAKRDVRLSLSSHLA